MKSILSLTTILFCIGALAQEPEKNPLAPKLIAEVEHITPGETFTVGVLIDHPKGYHSYWKHPGLVGVPWQLEWKLPAGFTAGEILWPLPEQVKMFDIDANGYRGKQLLMVNLTPPESLPLGEEIPLAADAIWMCCSQTCHPGHQRIELSLPVLDEIEKKSPTAPLFASARAALPTPLKQWEVSGRLRNKVLNIRIEPTSDYGTASRRDLGKLHFFCAQGIPNSDLPQEQERKKSGFQLKMDRWEFSPKNPTRLIGLLHAENGWTEEIHYMPVDVALEEKPDRKKEEKESSQTP